MLELLLVGEYRRTAGGSNDGAGDCLLEDVDDSASRDRTCLLDERPARA